MTSAAPEPAPPPPPDDALDDAGARRTIRDDLGATLIVEAAAGTGKTTMLVARIIAVLRAGLADLDHIVAVTFTEKAAGEMKLRLRAGLERERDGGAATPEERAHLHRALAQLEVARIGTIHSLCADVLREFPVEARVDPLFEVMPEEEAERLFEHCFDTWFQEVLQRPPEGVRRVLRRRAGGRDRVGPREALREAAWKLAGHRDFTAPWRRDPFDRRPALDAVVVPLIALARVAVDAEAAGDDYLAKALEKVRRFADDLARRELVQGRDHDGLEAELASLGRQREWTWRLRGGPPTGAARRTEAAALRDAARAQLDDVLARCNADLAACLHAELGPVVAAYDQRKARAGKLDFLDLLLRARDLVREGPGVRAELQQRFGRIFVDEFQDTDPLQAEILLLLAAADGAGDDYTRAVPAPGKLFLVGDPKQSIYRFRRADVALYETIKARLVAAGASLLYLTRSYRSAPAIQAAVNAAFAPAMTGGGSQAGYVPLQRHRDDLPGQPALVALPVPRPYSEWGKVTDFAVKRSLPDAVGAFVEWLIHESGWRVTERDAPEPVPIGARHVCLLFKRFQSFGDDLTRAYVRALEARRVPHVLVGGRSFYDREEVQAVKNALVAIEWPDDELALYATLRGPFFALSDDVLLAYRDAAGDGASMGPLHPLRALEAPPDDDDGGVAAVIEALDVLRRLHVGRNRRPIADTLERLLAGTRAHAGIAIWPTGEQALANVLRVLDMARRFEAQGATSFRAFVDRLDADAESGTAGEAPVVEEGTEGVRIMTVHRAKGLEFPVVILADPTAPVVHSQPTRHVDQERGLWAEALAGAMPVELLEHAEEVLSRDREENVRLAYVAATRARDLLVVPVVGDGPFEGGWLGALDPALYPDPRRRRDAGAGPGCPPFGGESVLERPPRAERDPDASVAPGLHVPQAGSAPVVWWDPAALGLGKEVEGGLRQQRILAADASNTVSEEGVLAHQAWAEKRAWLLSRGAEKTLPVRTVTEIVEAVREPAPAAWATREPGEPSPEALVELADTGVERRGRPRGKRFGTLVHAVLAAVELDAAEPAVAAAARVEGRLTGASPDEIDAATEAAVAALAHPLLRRAAESARRGECRRETPVVLPGSGGELIEGVVDLAFRDRQGWTVVDFKTDAEIAGKKARYETQVLLYVEAIRAATGEGARGVLLSV